MNTPASTLELASLRRRGIAATFAEDRLLGELYKLLWGLDLLTRTSRQLVIEAVGTGNPHAACRIMSRRNAFIDKGAWSLFWSVTHASIEISSRGFGSTHEPELNGAYMGQLRTSLAQFADPTGAANCACIIGDHATLGNEARSGADFGLILEVGSGPAARYVVCLLQAKRATSRVVDVRRGAGDSTQLDRLVESGIGSYLFYHHHDDPRGLGPTVRSADSIPAADASRVNAVLGTDDLAARLAAAVHQVRRSRPEMPGMGFADDRADAARLLFNPDVPDIVVNDVLVARVGDASREPASVVGFEDEWAAVIDEHRASLDRVRGTERHGRSDEFEPPIRGG